MSQTGQVEGLGEEGKRGDGRAGSATRWLASPGERASAETYARGPPAHVPAASKDVVRLGMQLLHDVRLPRRLVERPHD